MSMRWSSSLKVVLASPGGGSIVTGEEDVGGDSRSGMSSSLCGDVDPDDGDLLSAVAVSML